MRYQLVLQLSGTSIKDYDEMIEFEEEIIETIGKLGYVDGHDAGSAEMNIFVHTNSPELAFERIKMSQRAQGFMTDLKVAFREIGKDEYTILYPKGLTEFTVA